jgi:hypothetical protein
MFSTSSRSRLGVFELWRVGPYQKKRLNKLALRHRRLERLVQFRGFGIAAVLLEEVTSTLDIVRKNFYNVSVQVRTNHDTQ